MRNETWQRNIYCTHRLLKFSWSDTCWERGIWKTDIFWRWWYLSVSIYVCVQSVWGSYWRDGRWGYKCCNSFIRESYCLGQAGKDAEQVCFTCFHTHMHGYFPDKPGLAGCPLDSQSPIILCQSTSSRQQHSSPSRNTWKRSYCNNRTY